MFFLSSPKDIFCSLLLEREEGRQRKTSMWERSFDSLLPIRAWTSSWTRNLAMCPDWELNPQPFGVWVDAPTNWATLTRAYYINSFDLTSFLKMSWGPHGHTGHTLRTAALCSYTTLSNCTTSPSSPVQTSGKVPKTLYYRQLITIYHLSLLQLSVSSGRYPVLFIFEYLALNSTLPRHTGSSW